MPTALRVIFLVPLCALLLFAFSTTVYAAPVDAEGNSDGNLDCPSQSFYVYVKGGGKVIDGKPNLYGKTCISLENKDVAAKGHCEGPKNCKADLCDDKPCALPPIKVEDVKKAVYGDTPPPAVVPPPSLSDRGDVSGGLPQNPIPPGTNQSLVDQALFNPTPLAEQKDTPPPSANSVGEVLKRADTQPGVIDKIRDFFSPAPLNPNQDTFQLQPTKYDDFGNEIPQTVGPQTDSFIGADSTFTENKEQMQLTGTPTCDGWMSCMREKVSTLFNPSELEEAKARKLESNWNFGNMKSCSGGICSGYQSFSTPEEGAKADINNIAKWVDRGDDTLNKLMNRLSPSNDGNDTRGMVNYLSDKLGISPNTRLDLGNETQIVNLFNEKAFLEHSVRATDVMPSREIIGAYQAVAQNYGFQGDSLAVSQVPLPQDNPLVGGSYSYGPGGASGFDNLAAYNYFNDDNTAAWNEVKLNDEAVRQQMFNDAGLSGLALEYPSNDALRMNQPEYSRQDLTVNTSAGLSGGLSGSLAADVSPAAKVPDILSADNFAEWAEVARTENLASNNLLSGDNAAAWDEVSRDDKLATNNFFSNNNDTAWAEVARNENFASNDYLSGDNADAWEQAKRDDQAVIDQQKRDADLAVLIDNEQRVYDEADKQAALDEAARNNVDNAANDTERIAALAEYDKQKAAADEAARNNIDNAANDAERRAALVEYDNQKAAEAEQARKLEEARNNVDIAANDAERRVAIEEYDKQKALEENKIIASNEQYLKDRQNAAARALSESEKKASYDVELRNDFINNRAVDVSTDKDGITKYRFGSKEDTDKFTELNNSARSSISDYKTALDAKSNADNELRSYIDQNDKSPDLGAVYLKTHLESNLKTADLEVDRARQDLVVARSADQSAVIDMASGLTQKDLTDDAQARLDAATAKRDKIADDISNVAKGNMTPELKALADGQEGYLAKGMRVTSEFIKGAFNVKSLLSSAVDVNALSPELRAAYEQAQPRASVIGQFGAFWATDLVDRSRVELALQGWTDLTQKEQVENYVNPSTAADRAGNIAMIWLEVGAPGAGRAIGMLASEARLAAGTESGVAAAGGDALGGGVTGARAGAVSGLDASEVGLRAAGKDVAAARPAPISESPVWDANAGSWRDPKTGRFAEAPSAEAAPAATPKPVEPVRIPTEAELDRAAVERMAGEGPTPVKTPAAEPVAPKAVEPAAPAPEVASAAEKPWYQRLRESIFGKSETPPAAVEVPRPVEPAPRISEPVRAPTQAELDQAAVERMAGEGPTPVKTLASAPESTIGRSYPVSSDSPVRSVAAVPLDDAIATKTLTNGQPDTVTLYRGINQKYDPNFAGPDPFFTPDKNEAVRYALRNGGSEQEIVAIQVDKNALRDLQAYRELEGASGGRPPGFGEQTNGYVQVPQDWIAPGTKTPSLTAEIEGAGSRLQQITKGYNDEANAAISARGAAGQRVEFDYKAAGGDWSKLSSAEKRALIESNPDYIAAQQRVDIVAANEKQAVKKLAKEYFPPAPTDVVPAAEKSWLGKKWEDLKSSFGYGENPPVVETPKAAVAPETVPAPKVDAPAPRVEPAPPEIAPTPKPAEAPAARAEPAPVETIPPAPAAESKSWWQWTKERLGLSEKPPVAEPPAAAETPKAAVVPESAPAPKVDAPAPRVEPAPAEVAPAPKAVEPVPPTPELATAPEKSWWQGMKERLGFSEKPPAQAPLTQAERDALVAGDQGPVVERAAAAPRSAEPPAPKAEPAPAETTPPARAATEPAPIEPVKRGSGDVSRPNAEITMGDEGPVALRSGAENPSGKVWNDRTLTRDEFIADYKAVYPKTSLTDAQLAERYAAGKRLNPQTGQLKVPETPAPAAATTPAGTPAAPAVAGTPSLLSRAASWVGDNKKITMWGVVGGLTAWVYFTPPLVRAPLDSLPPENKAPAAPVPPVVEPPAKTEVPPPVVRKEVLPPVTRRDVVQTGYPDNRNGGSGDFCISSVNPVVVIPNVKPGPGCYNNPGQNSAWRTFPPMPPPPPPSTPSPTPTPTPTPTQLPVSPKPTPTPTSTPPVLQPYATLIANPSTVLPGGKSRLIWSSVNTSGCELFAPGSVSMATTTRGSTSTLPLATTTQFTLNCSATSGATTSAQTTVTVH
ncbi:hypothetical protein A3D71_03735 [Candidatus Kaiserbacteria bacterium RIFCSPHIGHO2_02_FULL_55_20]|uniref:Uncharacterized protein n=1 Tax=Candidatus Kaiserbacteria bacterium RIFCSPHIGHO2_02_FULL_55_20 TaxID=1798497 RepID=A0A1F6DY53_9BACT|nr:MAG: hypothetical protein A2680_00330 [Candidatus Kaiserbacteria bacterium RIFCSPHIGHO2_01_FULL_55_37]OGG66277.1 MAG: hypothetical protein A3D71_03735 [Candidatus Kaiserbacteria bacterium RIFCSPHIGHO2_02_FULL_55_20]